MRSRVGWVVLLALCGMAVLGQALPAWAAFYADRVYPVVGTVLSGMSGWVPFAVGDVFIAGSVCWLMAYPVYARRVRKRPWRHVARVTGAFLLTIYAWFYLAWGLNYSQPDFYRRTGITPVDYDETRFLRFAHAYVDSLNQAWLPVESMDPEQVRRQVLGGYGQMADSLGVHRPFSGQLRAKTMLFTPLASMVGVTGSMGPFFGECTLNGDLLPVQLPATYAHEMSHLLGIASEAEASFYAYVVCTHSEVPAMRFSGYFSVLGHVLSNAHRLLDADSYQALYACIRPEVLALARDVQAYWADRYSPVAGRVQNWAYDLYLRGNKIGSGRKNYSEVVELLLSWAAASEPM